MVKFTADIITKNNQTTIEVMSGSGVVVGKFEVEGTQLKSVWKPRTYPKKFVEVGYKHAFEAMSEWLKIGSPETFSFVAEYNVEGK